MSYSEEVEGTRGLARGWIRAARRARDPVGMTAVARYFDLVREMNNTYNRRLRLPESAERRGINPTGRLFATTAPPVLKRLRRFHQHGPLGLAEHFRAPNGQACQTSPEIELQVIAVRQQLPTLGAHRLIREIDFSLSHRALERVWRTHGP